MAKKIDGSLSPLPTGQPGEEIQRIPSPWGQGLPEEGGPPIRQINFNEGIAWSGPTSGDIPPIPKPLPITVPISPHATGPKIETVDPNLNIALIAQLLSSVLIQPRSFMTGHMTCGIANRGYQLPDVVVPPTLSVVVKSWFTNAGVIYVAHRQSDAQSTAVAWPLIANEGVGFRIPNVSGIWLMATVAGEGASFAVEQS